MTDVPERLSTTDAFIRACTLIGARRYPEAAHLLEAMRKQAGMAPETQYLLGVLAHRTGRAEEGAQMRAEALRKTGDAGIFWRNFCEAFRRMGDLDASLEAGLRATALRPSDKTAFLNLAMARHDRLELAECEAASRQAIALDPWYPEGHFRLAETLLLQGDFAGGLNEYEWRFRVKGAAPPIVSQVSQIWERNWDGSRIPGTLMLVADQGYGDCIQFSRYIPWAAERVGRVELAASREIAPVLQNLPGIMRTFNRWDDVGAWQAWLPLSGLPRLAGTRVDNMMPPLTLGPDPDRAARWRRRLDGLAPGLRRIGLAWAGRPTHNNDFNRSMAITTLAPLLAREDVAFVVLQKGPALGQLAGYDHAAPVLDLSNMLHDFGDSLAVMPSLDMVLGVDTAVVHLAGAAGVPVWTMLPYVPDWRWLLGRTDTPWYPSMRLFRQSAARKWDEVVAEVGRALDALPPVRRLEGAAEAV